MAPFVVSRRVIEKESVMRILAVVMLSLLIPSVQAHRNMEGDQVVIMKSQQTPQFQDIRWWRDGDGGKGYYRNYDRNQ